MARTEATTCDECGFPVDSREHLEGYFHGAGTTELVEKIPGGIVEAPAEAEAEDNATDNGAPAAGSPQIGQADGQTAAVEGELLCVIEGCENAAAGHGFGKPMQLGRHAKSAHGMKLQRVDGVYVYIENV